MRVLLPLFIAISSTNCFAQQASSKNNYLIGNSLTWDTIPGLLDGDIQWHVDCGKPLPYIYDNPTEPCVKTSTIWPKALNAKQYDQISIQPHYGSTLESDFETISKWVQAQPSATIIIHTGWAYSAEREAEYALTTSCGEMKHSIAYFDDLLAKLRNAFPGRTFKRTKAMDILQLAQMDIDDSKSPFKDISELYRDKIHMTHEAGRYLMHNAMRHALGQPFSCNGFDKTSQDLKPYLDSLLARTFR
jgi:hypothetical protein